MSTVPVPPSPTPAEPAPDPHSPRSPWEYDQPPAPGGGRRFAIAVVLTFACLASVVLGMVYWMKATLHPDYRGPEKLKSPEFPYYRLGGH